MRARWILEGVSLFVRKASIDNTVSSTLFRMIKGSVRRKEQGTFILSAIEAFDTETAGDLRTVLKGLSSDLFL